MTTIVTRAGKGLPLTNTELDANFTNTNAAKVELITLSYDSRATLRSFTPLAGEVGMVSSLGFFAWELGSTEPDDDESAFATSTGVWILQAPSWDLVDSWQQADLQSILDDDEDDPSAVAAFVASKFLSGSAVNTITSVDTNSSASFVGIVKGADVGDRVIAAPPAFLGDSAVSTGSLAFYAFVSAPHTVTVVLTNPSAVTATTNPAIRAAWLLTVIKT